MTDVKLLLLHSNTWNQLIVCKKKKKKKKKKKFSSVSFKNVINEMCLEIIYI